MSLADDVHVGVAGTPDLRTATEREADDNAAEARREAELQALRSAVCHLVDGWRIDVSSSGGVWRGIGGQADLYMTPWEAAALRSALGDAS